MVSKALERSKKIAKTNFLSFRATPHLSSIELRAISHERNFLKPNWEDEKIPLESKKCLSWIEKRFSETLEIGERIEVGR